MNCHVERQPGPSRGDHGSRLHASHVIGGGDLSVYARAAGMAAWIGQLHQLELMTQLKLLG
jgi:hypothetical protein